jgi:predicted O-methyltransferase YrrM
MNPEKWGAVDNYIAGLLLPSDPVLEAALRRSEEAGLPAIAVSPSQGKMLHLLARMQRARRILEIGTLGGYSAIWLARALPSGGRLVTLELEPRHAEVARENLDRAGLGGMVDLRVGPALAGLARLAGEKAGLFDLVFIDADKANIPAYFSQSLKLCQPGAVIIVDNVVRQGALINPADPNPSVQGVRRFHEMLATEPGVSATTIQTVGSKGWDGFTLALVIGET